MDAPFEHPGAFFLESLGLDPARAAVVSKAPRHFGEMDSFPEPGVSPWILICGRLLEKLDDPRPFLAWLRRTLLQNPENKALVFMADRGLANGQVYSVGPSSPQPGAPGALEDLVHLMEDAGFSIKDSGHLSQDAFVLTGCTPDHYEKFLESRRLPSKNIRHLLVTAEHAAFQATGGIGAYAQEMEGLLGPDALGICFVGEKEVRPEKLPGRQFLEFKRWITPESFFPSSLYCRIPKPDLVLDMVQQALLYYPGLQTVECQDCDGFGVRLAQAKRAGLLPEGLQIRVRCHGTYVYLENAHGKWWSDHYHLKMMYEEKAALELADKAVFATHFLRDFYQDAGYALDPDRTGVLRYPMAPPPLPQDLEYARVDTLVFVGGRTAMKGFPAFVEALEILGGRGFLAGVRKIMVLGKKDPAQAKENTLLAQFGRLTEVVEAVLPRERVLQTLAAHGSRALAVLPYTADNHPNAVLEAMACGCQMLAYDAGGIPELVPQAYHKAVLCPPDPESLAAGIQKALAMKPNQRRDLIQGLHREAAAAQQAVNQAHTAFFSAVSGQPEEVSPPIPQRIVVLACTRKDDQELLQALESQTLQPDEVVFAGNPGEKARAWKNLLKAGNGDLAIVLEQGFLPAPCFIERHALYARRNPETAAVTAYCRETGAGGENILRPLGQGLLLNLTESCLGCGATAFHLPVLRKIKGKGQFPWGASCEAVLARIASSGGRIGVIPEILSENTSATAGPRTFARGRELSPGLETLPRFETLRLAGMAQDYAQMQKSPAIAMARELERVPELVRTGKWALEKMAGFYFKLKK